MHRDEGYSNINLELPMYRHLPRRIKHLALASNRLSDDAADFGDDGLALVVGQPVHFLIGCMG
jgi:hypothetical protein